MRPLRRLLKLKSLAEAQCLNTSSLPEFRVAIVGSGPAGFYCSQSLLRIWPTTADSRCSVDLFEKLPVPYGLVRFGVAPDHPEVKNCTHSFEKLAELESKANGRLRFYGNVTVGRDVSLLDLRKAYHAVVLAYGSENEQRLDVPGSSANNCFSAKSFVNWYNSYPHSNVLSMVGSSGTAKNLNSVGNGFGTVKLTGLNSDVAVVFGHGNVALDVARILLTPVDQLAKTDISKRALDELAKSQIKKVILVGRRGPLQVSFTIAELREMTKISGCQTFFNKADFEDLMDGRLIEKLNRPKRRLTQLLVDTAKSSKPLNECQKCWSLKFLLSPVKIFTDAQNFASAVELRRNRLVDDASGAPRAVPVEPPNDTERIDCGLVMYSIGYETADLDGCGSMIRMDPRRRCLRTVNEDCCRIDTNDESDGSVDGTDTDLARLYGCGWCVTGPRGVLALTQASAKRTAEAILEDGFGSADRRFRIREKPDFESVKKTLEKNRVAWVDWQHWLKIDKTETDRGLANGKPREKIEGVEEMLRVVGSD